MSRDRRSKRYAKTNNGTTPRLGQRLAIMGVVVVVLGIALIMLWSTLTRSGSTADLQVDLGADPSLNPVEAAGLAAYIRLNQDALSEVPNPSGEAVIFEVTPGQDAGDISTNLFNNGLILDVTLFRNYLRYYGLDRQLEAGTYELSPSMTVPEIALALTDASAPEITIRIPEGWRREQIADWIDTQPDIPFTGGDFLAATVSTSAIPAELRLRSYVSEETSLEGFLFPDTYRVAINANADELVARMLVRLDSQFTPEMWAGVDSSPYSLHQILTLASIVEREAVVAEERPLIAGVYINRLQSGMMLQADPTVQYAMGFQPDSGEWWNLNLTQADYSAVFSPYNTYLNEGLPPGPIANPGMSSILAVIYPEASPYVFFRATCDGSGRHNFAVTFEEHNANACP